MEWHPGALAALFGVLSASIGLAAQPIKVREEMLYDRPVKTLDNGLVRVSVTPEIGGRVLVFRLNDGDRRTLHIARHNIRRKPGERWRGAEYGGLCDVATLDWPGPFWGVGYKIAETQAGGVAALRLSAQASEIGIEREVMLLPNSTICRIGVKQTNLARVPKSMVIRIHGEFALGECADNHDVILFNGPKGLVEIRYRLGWENPRFSFEHPVEGWMAYVDAREKLALVRRFLPVSKDIKVLVWHGHNEGGAVRDEKGGFYAIDRFMEPQAVEPGKTITAAEEYAIIDGLPFVDFVAEHVAGAVVLDRGTYGPGQKARATVVIGGGKAGGPYKVAVAAISPDGAKAELGAKTVPAHAPGKASSVTFEWAPKASCMLSASVADASGKPLAKATKKVVVDAGAFVKADLVVSKVMEYADQLVAALAAKRLGSTPQGQAQVALVRWYENQLRQAMTSGDFAAAETNGRAVIERLKASLAHVKALEAADQGKQAAIPELLGELK